MLSSPGRRRRRSSGDMSKREAHGRLSVRVAKARDLMQPGKAEPKVGIVVTVERNEARTHTHEPSCNPNINEKFSFDLTSGLDHANLRIHVYDLTKKNVDTPLGHARMSLGFVKDQATHDEWLRLRPTEEDGEVSGEVNVVVLYTPTEQRVSVEDFDLMTVIGKGSFGKVMQVMKKDTKRIYAMKVLRKEAIVDRDEVKHTRSEKNILGHIQHPFIVSLKYSFQTDDKLYLVMDYINGGELFFHLKRDKRFSEERVRFYTAEIVLALEHVHKYDIVYRDLKPENILLDMSGHICLTDFGLCKEGLGYGTTTNTFCGTPEYLAPEVLKGVGYGKAVDWWSLGILVFEMLSGLPPFYSQNVNVMYEKILNEKLRFPNHMSKEARSLLTGLLDRSPGKRLGGGPKDAGDIRSHAFFKGIDWDQVGRRKMRPPFKPNVSKIDDSSHFDKEFTSEPPVDSVVSSNNLGKTAQKQFEGFTYVSPGEAPIKS